MKQRIGNRTVLIIGALLMLCLTGALIPLTAAHFLRRQKQAPPGKVPAKHKQAVAAFGASVEKYVKLRERSEEKLPKLSKDSTPEQIEAHKTAFEKAVRAARAGAKQSDVFSPEIADYIRATIRTEFRGSERKELREDIMEADTKGVPLRVNYPYPETKELTQIPPTLLLKLPQLPKQLKYRFVGRHMLLVDRENGLIVDYMLDALP